MTYTEKELDQFLHGISLSLLSKKSAQHWRYDEETAKEIEWLEALERKVRADKADRKTENSSEKPNNCEDEQQTEYRIGYYTPTNAEILKALEDEPRTCFNCKHNVTKHTFDHACGGCIKMDRYEREDKQSGKE